MKLKTVIKRIREYWCWWRNGGHELYRNYTFRGDSRLFNQKCLFCTYETTGWQIDPQPLRPCIVDPKKVTEFKPKKKTA